MAGAGSAPPIAPLPLQWPLVGRHEELDLFSASLDDPRSHGFVIHGDAGVGKTRLADQCLAVADRHGRTVSRAYFLGRPASRWLAAIYRSDRPRTPPASAERART